MYEEKSIEIGRVMFIMDVILTSMIFAFTIWLRGEIYGNIDIDFFSHIALLPLLLLFVIGFLSYFGAYDGPCNVTMLDYGWSAFRAISLSIGLLIAVIFILNIDYISRAVILGFAAFEFLCLLCLRYAFKKYHIVCVRKGKNTSRVIIIGTGERAKELSANLREQSEWGIEVIGHLDPDSTRIRNQIYGSPVIGTVCDVENILKSNIVDEVIIAIPRSMLSDAEPIAQACEVEGIKLRFMADIFNLEVARTKLIKLGKTPILTLEPVAQDELKLIVKRFIDIVVTLMAMPIILPIMLIVAIAIKVNSPGPIFFLQKRVGLKKRLFPLLKFRSMYHDAEERLKEIEHMNEAEGPIFKMKNDPRVTTVGKFIRKTSLDELPQLFNVLRGEMSLVGPRPMSIRDVDLFDKGVQRKRFSVKPGITCIWQISGRSNLPFSKWLELDLKYIDEWSLLLDLKILFKTLPAVLFSKGAM